MKEIVTLQLGHLSNYVATHFWNTQESYFTYEHESSSSPNPPLVYHGVHWRPGVAPDGSDTFLPRTVIYDLKGGFGALGKINPLYEVSGDQSGTPASSLWTRPPVEHRLPRVSPGSYQQSLDAGVTPSPLRSADVRYWSDFSRVFFHPRSVVPLLDYELGSRVAPFDSWEAGADMFRSLEQDEDLIDRDLRPFAEEADQLQGIQLLTTTSDSWGAFAAAYLERLRDEFGKTCIWTWAIQDVPTETNSAAHRRLRLHNTARSFLALNELASALVPLSLPRSPLPSALSLDPTTPWHVSALLATGLESATLSSRLQVRAGSADTLDDLVQHLNIRGNQKIARLRLTVHALPLDPTEPASGAQNGLVVKDDDDKPDFGMNLSHIPGSTDDTRSSGTRPKETGIRNLCSYGQVEMRRAITSFNTGPSSPKPGRLRRDCSIPFPVLDSFPSIFSAVQNNAAASSVGLRTILSTDSSIAGDLDRLRTTTANFFGLEEREAIMDSLGNMADAYKDGWSSGSDEDDE